MNHFKRILSFVLAFCMVLTGGVLPTIQAKADDGVDYLYGYVNMNYADYYYGELENIEPDDKTTVTPVTEDLVTAAGYRETGYYDAATFATPGSFIYEAKWETWPGTYSEPIKNEFGVVEGGKILGVADVAVAVDKKLIEAAKADPDATVLNEKLAEITWAEDQSAVPVSYKVLNSDAVYTKWIGATDTTVNIKGSLYSNYMGDDNWWEGSGFTVANNQTIVGGFVEWTGSDGSKHREGLKHDENIYNTKWIGWGVGPNAVGIYGGNEVGWQRFVTMAGGTMTKLSLILQDDTGAVIYMNGDPGEEGTKSPWLLNGIVEEDGSMPYDVVLTNYEYTKDKVIIDFDFNVPTINGEPEADIYLYSFSIPCAATNSLSYPCPKLEDVVFSETDTEEKKAEKIKNQQAKIDIYNQLVSVADESEWVNGHKTLHLELNREYFGTGRFKYWSKSRSTAEGGRTFGMIARWADIKTGLTMNDMYIEDNKLVINSDIFTVADYRNNPYQKVVIKCVSDPSVEDVVFSTGDSNSNVAIMTTMLKEDGSFDFDAIYKYTTGRGASAVSHEDPFFAAGAEAVYDVTMYCGGYAIVHGTINGTAQEITAADVNATYGDAAFNLNATAQTTLSYASDNEEVATVAADGTVTIVGTGVANITIIAAEENGYFRATKTVAVNVAPAAQKITVTKSSITKTYGNSSFSLGAKAVTDLTYKTSNSKVATVSSTGKVTIKGAGTATITIKAAATANYSAASKTVTITVNPGKVTLSSVKSTSAKKATVTWKKRSEATGYKVYYSTSKKFSSKKTVTISKNSTVKTTLKNLKSKKTIYVKVRAYKKSGSKTLYGAYSSVKSVKVK